MEIIECRAADIELLERVAPTGLNRGHQGKYERQLGGLATYLVAWLDGEPVAHGQVRWDGCASPIVQAAVRHHFEDPCTFLVQDFAVTPPR